ncbi:Mut7-C RNAse domain-containing protein [Halorussus halophilus]|uniref:Mut7-C RNAse domain-containing protein n=1 Tax=Halorussus halophilus TaxID=2650975 RepID=UPI0013016AD3|nr:Mut7-C RNAse domain-containing protein [Halorussus halophilus]
MHEDERSSSADTSLLLDVMLGKLATYLRMCGYDAAYALDCEPRSDSERTSGEERSDDPRGVEADDRLLELAREDDRLLLTRDVALAERAGEDGMLLESHGVTDQLAELASAGFELELTEPARCASCNGELVEVDGTSEQPTPEYAPSTEERRVWRCAECGQHFWKGSHWESVKETLSTI